MTYVLKQTKINTIKELIQDTMLKSTNCNAGDIYEEVVNYSYFFEYFSITQKDFDVIGRDYIKRLIIELIPTTHLYTKPSAVGR